MSSTKGRRVAGGNLVHVSGEGRGCAYPSCTTMLSKYNPDDFCAVHNEAISVDGSLILCKTCGNWLPETCFKHEDTCKFCEEEEKRATMKTDRDYRRT